MKHNDSMAFTDIGSGFPVLMGHSYLFDRSMWSTQIDQLSKTYRLIIPDLWGHGESPALPESVQTISDLAADHLALMDQLNITDFAVVGLSVGGMWGAELAALAPDRVKALMLFDTYSGSETPQAWQSYLNMLNAVEAAGVIESPIHEYIVTQFYSINAMMEDINNLHAHLSSLTAENLRTSIIPLGKIIFGRSDRMTIFSDIKCPVHIATGAFDLPRPPEEGLLMADKIGCEFTLIPRAGHISNRENPEFVTALIRKFIQEKVS